MLWRLARFRGGYFGSNCQSPFFTTPDPLAEKTPWLSPTSSAPVGKSNQPGLVGHELEHGYQYEKGEISFGEGKLYDLTDEVGAYNRQNAIDNGVQYFLYPAHYVVNITDVWNKVDSKGNYLYRSYETQPINLKSKIGKSLRKANKGKTPQNVTNFYINWQKDL